MGVLRAFEPGPCQPPHKLLDQRSRQLAMGMDCPWPAPDPLWGHHSGPAPQPHYRIYDTQLPLILSTVHPTRCVWQAGVGGWQRLAGEADP